MVHRLWDGEEHADVELMDEVRDRVENLFCGGNGRMVIHPSGTDAETMPLLQAVLESRHIARSREDLRSVRPAAYAEDLERGNVVSLVACAGEVGSGTTEAAMGRFFSKSVPLGGNRVAMGQELPALHDLADMSAVELVARGGPDALDGGARADYDELVLAEAEKALSADPACVVVLHTVAGSKTGLRLPFARCGGETQTHVRPPRRLCAGRVPDAPPPGSDPALAGRARPRVDDLFEVLRGALPSARASFSRTKPSTASTTTSSMSSRRH
jgi:hypothetical protein